jgi:hypothetical protein
VAVESNMKTIAIPDIHNLNMFLSSTSLNHLYLIIHCNRKKQTWKRKYTAAYRVTATANATFSGTIDTSIKNRTA